MNQYFIFFFFCLIKQIICVIVFRNIPKDIFILKLEKIRKAISELVIEKYPTMHITVSMGGVNEEGKVEELFNKADYLLYQAKKEKNHDQPFLIF